jgi:hypothetical protein
MKTRNFALCALGLAAAITVGSADTASAQAKSDKRIPVRKEGPVEQTVRVDTVRLAPRVDTVMVRGRTDTVVRTVERVRVDTVMQMLPIQKLPGLYFGVGAGVAIPFQSWRNTTKDGPDVNVQVGWFPKDGALGIRFDGNGAFFGRRETDCPLCPSPKLWSGSGDVVLRFPLDRTSKLNPVFYVLGGGGIDKFSDFLPYRNSDGKIVTAGEDTFLSYPGLTLTTTTRGSKSWYWHYEGGAGMDFNLGAAHLFVESKYASINTINGNSHYFPTIAGLKFY